MAFSWLSSPSQLISLERLKDTKILFIHFHYQGENPNKPWRSQIRIVLIGSPQEQFGIDLQFCDPFPILLPLLRDTSILKVMRHAKRPIKHLLYRFQIPIANPFCIDLAARLSGMGNRVENQETLAALADRAAHQDPEDARFIPSGMLNEALVQQLAQECDALLAQYEWLNERINHYKLRRVAQLEFRTIAAVAAMELRGIAVDPAKLDQLALQYRSRIAALEAEIGQHFGAERNLFGELELNLQSPEQLREALARKGILLADAAEHSLRPLVQEHPFIGQILEHRHLGKLLNFVDSQLRSAIDPDTKRIHATYHQIASASGRFACTDPNMQQVPRENEIRACIVPAEGCSLIVADYSQVELRVAAGLSGDRLMLEAYQRGEDLHRLTAAIAMGKPLEAVEKNERQAAKAINFGLIYAMGANGLRNSAKASYGVDMSHEEASLFRRRYFENYQGIANWQREMERIGKGQGYIRTAAGRIRSYRGEALRVTELLNTPVQGTAAEGLKSALCLFYEWVQESGMNAGIVAIIHDEILVEVQKDQAEATLAALKSTMIRGISWLVPGVAFEVDAAILEAWHK